MRFFVFVNNGYVVGKATVNHNVVIDKLLLDPMIKEVTEKEYNMYTIKS